MYLLDPYITEDSYKNIKKLNIAIVDDEMDLIFVYKKRFN